MARKAGVRIAIDTDAHEASQFNHVRWGVMTARRGWMSAADVIASKRHKSTQNEGDASVVSIMG